MTLQRNYAGDGTVTKAVDGKITGFTYGTDEATGDPAFMLTLTDKFGHSIPYALDVACIASLRNCMDDIAARVPGIFA